MLVTMKEKTKKPLLIGLALFTLALIVSMALFFVAPFGAVQWLSIKADTTLEVSVWTSYQNDFDEALWYAAPSGSAICGVSSYHVNSREDRRFRFKTCTPSGGGADIVGMSDECIGRYSVKLEAFPSSQNPYHNFMVTCGQNMSPYDAELYMRCGANRVLSAVMSFHDNGKEDREWQLRCHKYKNSQGTAATFDQCYHTGYITSYDNAFAFQCRDGFVIDGIMSKHDNHREDRIFGFSCCRWKA